jgi:hypothetical protein
MTDDPDTLRTHLDRLTELADLAHRALITPPEDRARMERAIQLICRALQTVAWVRQRTGPADRERGAPERSGRSLPWWGRMKIRVESSHKAVGSLADHAEGSAPSVR